MYDGNSSVCSFGQPAVVTTLNAWNPRKKQERAVGVKGFHYRDRTGFRDEEIEFVEKIDKKAVE